jgi:putative MATE family efflux protein
MVFMSLIGAIDTVMVGDLGFAAIAAVGLAGQPRMLTLTLFFALNTGLTAVVARRKGQGRQGDANLALRNALMLVLVLTVAVMLFSLSLSDQLLRLAGAQEDTIGMAGEYFRTLVFFLPVNALTMCINAAQRGVGNTRTTLYVNVAANVVNVLFNYLLIYGHWGFPRLGVTGNALATGLGICVGFVLCLLSLFNKKLGDNFLQMSFRDSWKPHRETLLSIIKIGGNAMVEQGAVRIGFFTYAAIVASLGTASLAAHTVGMQFLNISFTFGDGLAVAGTSLVGQMLGKERPDIATIYGKCCQRVALCVSLIMAASIIAFRYPLVGIFLDPVPESIEPYNLAANLMLMVSLFQPLQMSTVVFSGCLRGAGDNLHVALVMIICVVFVRPLISLFAIHVLGFQLFGAWSASVIDMSIRLTLMYKRFQSGIWQTKKV